VPLEAGQQLQHYCLIEQIGEGGMGVVWRGRDTKLDRDVAIKILPDDFAQNPDRLARFAREAKLLASLNHAGIATIHGLEQDAGVHFLAMELIEGEDLAARIGRGAIAIEEALPLAQQIASALEAAHEQGVIHRDLKPANVKITPEGNVKVLDFGLAKAFGPDASDPTTSPTMSPTVTSGGETAIGVILGTAAYMSPEQAKGKPVDRRADNWSFGVVLLEMFTGRLLFRGDSVSETIAAVLMAEPDLSTLPANTPPKVRRLIERCLRKDPQSRLRDMGDARVVIEEALAGREWENVPIAGAAARPPRLSAQTLLFPGVPLLLLGLAAGAFLLGGLLPREDPPGTPAYVTVVPESVAIGSPSISPDGSRIAWAAEGGIRVRDLDHPEERLLPVGAVWYGDVEFSPDSQWVAFRRDGRMNKVPADGSGLPSEIGKWPWPDRFLWLEDGRIVGANNGRIIYGINAIDGSPLAEVEATGFNGTNVFDLHQRLPGDPRYAFGAADSFESDGTWQISTVIVDTLNGESTRLIGDAESAAWSPSGHLVFSRANDLLVVPFDIGRREMIGNPVTLLTGLKIWGDLGSGYFDLAAGNLLYTHGAPPENQRIVIADPEEKDFEVWSDTKRIYWDHLAIAPTGDRFLAMTGDLRKGLNQIWISELDRDRLRPLVAVPGRDCAFPEWSPGGDRVVYGCGSEKEVRLYVVDADGKGSPEEVPNSTLTGFTRLPELLGFHPDGQSCLVAVTGPEGVKEFRRFPLAGADEPSPTTVTDGLAGYDHRLSPDGWCVSYMRNHTGKTEIYLRCLDASGELGDEKPLTPDGGWQARWAPVPTDGRFSLTYNRSDGVFQFRIRTHDPVEVSEPSVLWDRATLDSFANGEGEHDGCESLGGARFLCIQSEKRPESDNWFQLVLNFDEVLRVEVPK
jgi:serine/threonine-protein kinase